MAFWLSAMLLATGWLKTAGPQRGVKRATSGWRGTLTLTSMGIAESPTWLPTPWSKHVWLLDDCNILVENPSTYNLNEAKLCYLKWYNNLLFAQNITNSLNLALISNSRIVCTCVNSPQSKEQFLHFTLLHLPHLWVSTFTMCINICQT